MTNEKPMSLRTWNRLTPQQRDYERYVGVIPQGASWKCETPKGKLAVIDRDKQLSSPAFEQDCSCHINPPTCTRCLRSFEAMR